MALVQETEIHRSVKVFPQSAAYQRQESHHSVHSREMQHSAETFSTPQFQSSVTQVQRIVGGSEKQPDGYIRKQQKSSVKVVSYPGVAQITMATPVGLEEAVVQCPSCHQLVTTRVERKKGGGLFSCCTGGSKEAQHYCSLCNRKIEKKL